MQSEGIAYKVTYSNDLYTNFLQECAVSIAKNIVILTDEKETRKV